MIDAIIQKLPEGYNGGRIEPSGEHMHSSGPLDKADSCPVFIFPPRSVDGLGPMFWSPQLLTFAGVRCFLPFRLTCF